MSAEETLIKQLAFYAVLVMLLVLGLAFFIKPEEGFAQKTGEQTNTLIYQEDNLLKYTENREEKITQKETMGSHYLRIEKNKENSFVQVSLKDLYQKKSLQIIFHGLKSKDFTESSISWTEDGIVFDTKDTQEEKKQKSLVSSVSLTYNKEESDSSIQGIFTVKLDQIYAQTLYEDESYIYVGLKDPHQVYDQILVVDAGHGGEDTGAYSQGKTHDEKDLNLQILLKLKKILDQKSIKVYYTRLKDENIALEDRVQMANELNADFFISLHCNFSKNNNVNGTEVIYSDKKNQTTFQSKQLARVLLDVLLQEIPTKKRRLVDDESILILNRSKVPVSIIEIAYISNQSDLTVLLEEESQKQIAEGIYKGIEKAYEKRAEGEK